RVAEAWLHGLATIRVSVPARCPAARRPRQALAGLPAESSRGNRCYGFLHRADVELPSVVPHVVIEHARRRILHFHVTAHPDSDWAIQQLLEAFPDATPY